MDMWTTVSNSDDGTTWDMNKEEFRISKRGQCDPLDVGKLSLEKECPNKDAKRPDDWMMDSEATSNRNCWDSMLWPGCAASIYPPDAATPEINKEEGKLSNTGQQDSLSEEMADLGEHLTTSDADRSFEMMMAKEIASIRNCWNIPQSEKPVIGESPFDNDSQECIQFGNRNVKKLSVPGCMAIKSEPEHLKMAVILENKDGEDEVLVTQEDSEESAEELKFSSSTAMNGVSQTLNPERSVMKRQNLTDDGQDQASKLANRVEPPQTTQKPCASTESGQSFTESPNWPQCLGAGKSDYDVWFECYQRNMMATHAAQEVSDSSESSDELSVSSDSVQHHKVQTGVVMSLCTKCKVPFSGSLHQCNDSYRAPAVKETYKCPECNKLFLSTHGMNHHRRMVHHGTEVYQCTKCTAHFSLASKLRQHQRMIHNMERQYSCPYCTETFSRYSQLIKHRRAHTGELRYECTECDKSFKKEIFLKLHQGMHRGEKPYKCVYCDARFNKNGEYRNHKKSHKKEMYSNSTVHGIGYT